MPIDKSDSEVNRLLNGSTGGGELFEKFRLQKQNKENIIATNGDRYVLFYLISLINLFKIV